MFGLFTTRTTRLMKPLLFALIVLSVFSAQAQDAVPTATLPAGQLTAGTLTREGDTIAQVFTFSGSVGDQVTLTATSDTGLALALLLTTAEGQFVGQARDIGATGQVVLNATLEQDGDFFVTVLPVVGVASLSEGTYSLLLETNAQPVIDVEATELATAEVDVPDVAVTTSGMQVTLTWDSTADMDLEVRDPVGNTLYFSNPVIDFGGTFGVNANGACEATTANAPTEQATWSPGGVPVGSYEVLVYYSQGCDGTAPVSFTINVTVDGTPLAPVQGTLLPDQVYISSYELALDGTAVMSSLNGVRGEETLPASAAVIIRGSQPLTYGTTVDGFITNEQPYQSYAFTAAANDIITVNMNANSGSLDPYIAVLDPTGNVIYFNDDAAEGVTDSALTNSLLAIEGTYTLVATRYGLAIGGTEGGYQISLNVAGAAPTTAPGATPLAAVTPAAPVAQDVPAEVAALALPDGTIEVTLLWNTGADLQLLLRDPAGDSVFDDSPSIRSGGRLGAAGNVNCTAPATNTPVSYIYYPANITPRAGSYELDVWFQSECNDTTPVSFTLYASVANQAVLTESVTASRPFLPGEHFVTSFTINDDGTVVAGEGGLTGLASLNWEAEAASAAPIAAGDAPSGSITLTNKFDLYAFDGLAGDIVSISMTAAPGTNLDTNLYLIGPNGSVVSQNDDAVAGENTDSLINNFTLPEDGQYIIIATHYGEQYGVTSGAYTLTLDL